MSAEEAEKPSTAVPALVHLQDLASHQDRAWNLAWNPRLPLLASCSTDKTVHLHSFRMNDHGSTNGPSPSSPSLVSTRAHPRFELRESIPTGHSRTVRGLSWAPSGKTLATASFDSTVGIWERVSDINAALEGKSVEEPPTLGHYPEEGPEWDCIGTLEGHESECKAVSFSPSGTHLASCSRDRSVWVWEVQPEAEFECLSVLMDHSQDVKCVLFHPHVELLASASYDDQIRLYIDDPSDDWFCISTLSGHEGTVWDMAFSPDGKYLASASADCTVRIWRRLNEEEAAERGLKPDGKMPGRKGEKWVCVDILKGHHSRTIYSVSWGHDSETKQSGLGRIATAGGDGRICVFQMQEPAEGKMAPSRVLIAQIDQAHEDADVNSVRWAPRSLKGNLDVQKSRFEELNEDGDSGEDTHPEYAGLSDLLASAGDDGTVKIWTVPDSKWARNLTAP
ncbi:WD40 repeat-like protein [Ceraceosorus guamensis]|uniref:Probable cytosolic iron-sulfur protein assembly protein 1 n=1 Tax=Ceraceosorus guamensis TaxID=1522189 RepID=A0A316VUM6_9BASI|nr:WD40 repeat-like protein [Ceraceosorus guamensis]PWN41150.1 WD40 repeat-like protein [Ceraceosorus guamensis]